MGELIREQIENLFEKYCKLLQEIEQLKQKNKELTEENNKHQREKEEDEKNRFLEVQFSFFTNMDMNDHNCIRAYVGDGCVITRKFINGKWIYKSEEE